MHKSEYSSPFTSLQRLWLCESIRLHEQHNPPLEDSEACRQARQTGNTLAKRIELRNLALASREGLDQALRQWLTAVRWLTLLLVGLAILTGYGLASASLSRHSEAINVIWALFGLLGLHGISFIFWLIGMFYRSSQPSQFMQLPLGLLERLSHSPHAARLSTALFSLLSQNRLLPAALSRLVHGWWFITLLVTLITSLALLSTHRYAFAWESTIASADTFVTLVQVLGWPGHILGFALPDAELIRTSGEQLLTDELSRQAWASWLIGLLVVYGLLPRLLLAVYYQWRWRHGQHKLRLDAQSSDWTYLHARLQPAEQNTCIVDPQPAHIQPLRPTPALLPGKHGYLVGLELEQPLSWPITPPPTMQLLGNLDGYQAQQALLEQLTATPCQSMTLAFDFLRSPDRGSLYFISELARSCNGLYVWLLHPDSDPQRLDGWQQALTTLNVSHGTGAPWLHTGAANHE